MNILCALLYILVNSYTLSHSLASKVDSNQTSIRSSSGSEDVKGIILIICPYILRGNLQAVS